MHNEIVVLQQKNSTEITVLYNNTSILCKSQLLEYTRLSYCTIAQDPIILSSVSSLSRPNQEPIPHHLFSPLYLVYSAHDIMGPYHLPSRPHFIWYPNHPNTNFKRANTTSKQNRNFQILQIRQHLENFEQHGQDPIPPPIWCQWQSIASHLSQESILLVLFSIFSIFSINKK